MKNFIKSRALNHRQFQEFLEDVEAEHGDLMFYCEVRWLSKGNMLRRFYDLKEQVSVFMNMKDKAMPELDDPAWMCDVAFLVDVTSHLNELNTKLQSYPNPRTTGSRVVRSCEIIPEQTCAVKAT